MSTQEGQAWHQTDPYSLIEQVREQIADLPREKRGPINEVVSRFELQTKALMGASTVQKSS